MRKSMMITLLILAVGLRAESGNVAEKIERFRTLTEEQKTELIKDVIRISPFKMNNRDIKSGKDTVGKFFNARIYGKLKGNDILGYIYDNGFNAGGKTVSLGSVRFLNGTDKFRKDFMKILKMVLNKYGFTIKNRGNIEMGFALLDVETEKSDVTLPGGTMEYYLKNKSSGRYLFHRLKTGNKKGIKYAFLELAIVIAGFMEI